MKDFQRKNISPRVSQKRLKMNLLGPFGLGTLYSTSVISACLVDVNGTDINQVRMKCFRLKFRRCVCSLDPLGLTSWTLFNTIFFFIAWIIFVIFLKLIFFLASCQYWHAKIVHIIVLAWKHYFCDKNWGSRFICGQVKLERSEWFIQWFTVLPNWNYKCLLRE